MKVDIWSDIRCPFCYVGKKKFEKALEQFPNSDQIEVQWHSFQLDPNLVSQPDKNPYEYFTEMKGISMEQAKAMHEHVKNAGKEAGIDFNFDDSKVANSHRGHLLIQLANKKNIGNEMEEAMFKAQFIDGKNIDDEAALLEIGQSVGLTKDEIQDALHSDNTAHAVSQDGLLARQLGINAVPFFVFNDKYGVSGAQQPELFLEILEKSFSEYSAGDQGLKIINSGDQCDINGNCD
ncbi:DsbA family oxidoreductase [Kaistella montana]|uniref:DsbA family protein n=1 Tax=Kaistella montana TaxID=1849733 RepID=A0ABW5KAB0_9FLAO|nr:DsbA family oxidoreductase [Kaistella montana]MCQ4035187.1 DsbA family oxidoreductase [Kaistella montana]